MPRPAVAPDKRRRVVRACDSCKRRKERCNGVQPCVICVRRRKQHECNFSDTPARLLRPSSNASAAQSESREASLNERKSHTDSGISINRLLNEPAGDRLLDPSLTNQQPRSLSSESGAEVPNYARLLRDSEGKYMHIGDSASLSFLQSVRRIVALAVGECEFTTDPKRHSILETVPCHMTQNNDQLHLVYKDVEHLARQYLLATAGLLDMFDMQTFWAELEDWVSDPLRDSKQRSCIFYLILAIGAQATFEDCEQVVAERYFCRGRQQAFYNFTDAPSLMTVQAYTLITIYMLGACRRNGAFMNFGIACRATYALGMHTNNTHGLFDERESRDRQNTWRSVRMLDVFFAASLGRPPATYDLSAPMGIDSSVTTTTSDFSQKVLSLSAIYDRIVIEVYIKKAVSTRLAESISQQLRSWTQALPSSLNLDSFPSYDEGRLPEILAATHVISSYHWAIILLTRPFLTSQILQDMSRKKNGKHSRANKSDDPVIKTFADACVESSLRGLEVVDNLLKYRTLPKRLPILMNAVCNIALVLGAAVFADQDKNFPLVEGLEQALKVMRHFTPHDPHANRYEQVIAYLSSIVRDYIRMRNRQSMEHRSQEVSQLFGSLSRQSIDRSDRQQTPSFGPTPTDSEVAEASSGRMGMTASLYDSTTPASIDPPQSDMSELLAFNNAGTFPDAAQPPSSIFQDVDIAFPDDAYLFMEQEPSIFGFWTGQSYEQDANNQPYKSRAYA